MRLRPLLLHALLSLALVANGTGAAMASVHEACAHDTVAASATVAESPCHGGTAVDASSAHSGMSADTSVHEGTLDDRTLDGGMLHNGMDQGSTSHHASTSDDQGCGDCADRCQCACIANGFAVLIPPTLLISASTGIRYAPATSYAHRAPTLPHPVRPPIG